MVRIPTIEEGLEINEARPRQPPFTNPRASKYTGYPDLTGEKLFRGWIIEERTLRTQRLQMSGWDWVNPKKIGEAIDVAADDENYRLVFHYNPLTISEQWEVDLDVAEPSQTNPYGYFAGVRTKGVSFSFSLVLDRTGDLANVPEGVAADLRILVMILTSGIGGANKNTNALAFPMVRVVFTDPQASKWPMGLTGSVVEYSVQYTRFSRRMVPLTAIVNLKIRADFYMPDPEPGTENETSNAPTTRESTFNP